MIADMEIVIIRMHPVDGNFIITFRRASFYKACFIYFIFFGKYTYLSVGIAV